MPTVKSSREDSIQNIYINKAVGVQHPTGKLGLQTGKGVL
jgi:hypothetical protein